MLRSFLSFFLLSLATSMMFWIMCPCRHQQNPDQTIVTFRQSLTDTCNLLYEVLESVKGLIGFSSFLLLHLPFGNISHFPKEPIYGPKDHGSLDIKTTGRSGFPYLEQAETSESTPALCHHQQELTKPNHQVNSRNGAAFRQAEPA